MLCRALLALGLSVVGVLAADEVLTDKSTSAKVLALYQKTLAAAQKRDRKSVV